MVMEYRDRVFRNAMMVEIGLEVVAWIMDKPVMLDVAMVALATTAILWQVFLAGDRKTSTLKGTRKAARRAGTR